MKNKFILSLCNIILLGMGYGIVHAQSSMDSTSITTRITAIQKSYEVGKPMRIKLEMSNLSSETVKYRAEGLDDMLEITGPDGTIIPFVEGKYMNVIPAGIISPKQTITLDEDWDFSEQYPIIKQGEYKIKFVGNLKNGMQESKPIEIRVKTGKIQPMDSLLWKLIPIIPKDWSIAIWNQKKDFSNQARLGKELVVNGFFVTFVQPNMKYITQPGVQILVTDKELNQESIQKATDFSGIEYLGKNKIGYVYLVSQSPESTKLWPEVKTEITQAIKE